MKMQDDFFSLLFHFVNDYNDFYCIVNDYIVKFQLIMNKKQVNLDIFVML